MWQDFGRGGCFIFWLLLIAATNFASKWIEINKIRRKRNNLEFLACETDTEVIKPVDEVEELSIDAEFPITEGPPQTTVKPECVRLPEAGVLFTSDNFPGKYLKDTNCTYKMRAVKGRRVQLTFFVFDVSLQLKISDQTWKYWLSDLH